MVHTWGLGTNSCKDKYLVQQEVTLKHFNKTRIKNKLIFHEFSNC